MGFGNRQMGNRQIGENVMTKDVGLVAVWLRLLGRVAGHYPALWVAPLVVLALGGWSWVQRGPGFGLGSELGSGAIALPPATQPLPAPPQVTNPRAIHGTRPVYGPVAPGSVGQGSTPGPAIALPPPPSPSSSLGSTPPPQTAHPLPPQSPITSPSPASASVPPSPPKTKPVAAAPAPTGADQWLSINVAIAEGDTALAVGFSAGGVITSERGEILQTLGEGRTTLSPNGETLTLAGQTLPGAIWLVPQGTGLVYVRDRAYRGKVLVTSQGNSTLAVNQVDFRSYLTSVVGSEVSPSWPVAALKAQAVAARSYALTYYWRPAHSLYNMGDSESYQVYKGVQSEDPRVQQAVDATSGQFVSYQGGIVESMYAASEAIVRDAFQGPGMSQLGALELAEQGYRFEQILAHYYPGTGIGQLNVEGR